MRLYIQGGSLKLLVPVLEPEQNIGWLKSDFKLRALRRGRDGKEPCVAFDHAEYHNTPSTLSSFSAYVSLIFS